MYVILLHPGYFEQQGDNNSLSDKLLTQKLLILLLLLGAYRISTVKLFSVSNMVLNDLSVTLIPTEVLKHSRIDKPLGKFEYISYTDKKLCIISCLREYLTRPDKHVDDYSFELHQECVDKCHIQCLCNPPLHLSTHSDTTDK